MGRNGYEREKDRERPRQSRSRSRSYRRQSHSPYRGRNTNEGEKPRKERSGDRYPRRSRSPRRKYRRKTSRENSAENEGNVLYISNLSKRVRDDELTDVFNKVGKVSRMQVVRDPFSKECRGFGFVTMENRKEAEASIEELNKTEVAGKPVTVEKSKRSRPHHSTPGVYLGPSSSSTKRRRPSPHYERRRHPRVRSRSYHRDEKSPSRSRSKSFSYRRRR